MVHALRPATSSIIGPSAILRPLDQEYAKMVSTDPVRNNLISSFDIPLQPKGFQNRTTKEIRLEAHKAEAAREEFTLFLMYLTRFSQESYFGEDEQRSWKGYDFKVLQELGESGAIQDGRHPSRTKSVVLSAMASRVPTNL